MLPAGRINSDRFVSAIHGGRNNLKRNCENTDDIVAFLSLLSSVFVNIIIYYHLKGVLISSDYIVSNDRMKN